MKAVIMAAGKSTRTYPLTLTRPKPLLRVANRAILERHLDALKGIVEGVVIVVGYMADMIREAFGDSYDGLPLEYVEQAEPLGTGHAILMCADSVDGPFLAINGDDLYHPNDLEALAGAPQAALVKIVEDPRPYGIYEVDDGDRVIRIVEKPKEVFSNLANVGAYKLTPQVFEILSHTERSERGEIEITSAIQVLAEEGEFRVVKAEGYWLAMAYPWQLLDTNAFFLETELVHNIHGEVSPAAHINGTVSVGRGAVIRSGVVIDGPVCIGEDCSIGPNCWLRPNTALGRGCRVGQAVEIKNSILMAGAKASHQCYIGDSIVGEGADLGCGTVTANVRHDGGSHKSVIQGELVDTGRSKLGAIIGDNVHTGIHTSIYPGRKLWPNVTTLPGEVVRQDIVT